ncbi:MAG: hypothetical protein QM622_08795 [Microbacterium sp.]
MTRRAYVRCLGMPDATPQTPASVSASRSSGASLALIRHESGLSGRIDRIRDG